MSHKIEDCPSCYQSITNPICEHCYTKQLAIWLNDYARSPKTIQYIIRRLRHSFQDDLPTDVFCIICGNQTVSMCTPCYFRRVETVLRELNLPRELIENFLQAFHYKLYNKEYSV